MVVHFKVVLSLILLSYELLHHTSAFQNDQAVIRDSLKGRSGYFDLNNVPQEEIEHAPVNSNPMSKDGVLETSGHRFNAPRKIDLQQDGIISRPQLSHEIQTQDIQSTSNLGNHDKSVISPSQVSQPTHGTELQSAMKEIRINLENLIRFTPENKRENILHSSVKDLLDPKFLLGSQRPVKDNRIGLERMTEDKVKEDMKSKIRSFQTLIPIAIPAAASTFYAGRLLRKMGDYLIYDQAYKSGAWMNLWNTKTILPFVYFIISCNPSYYMWERIEAISVSAFKAYDELYILGNSDYDKEDLIRYLVWHTELMYYAARSSDLIELPEGTYQPRYLSRTKASPISRILAALLRTPEYKQYTSSRGRVSRREHLKRYIQQCWRSDMGKDYPRKRDEFDLQASLWDDWISKSTEIDERSQKIQWPSTQDGSIKGGKNSPILLVRKETDLPLNEKESGSGRILSFYSKEFKEMLQKVQSPVRPKLRLTMDDQDIFHGLSYFLESYSKRNLHNEADISENSLDLLSEFLEQDPQSTRFVAFWSEFNIHKEELMMRKIARLKDLDSKNEENYPNKRRRVSGD